MRNQNELMDVDVGDLVKGVLVPDYDATLTGRHFV